MDDDGAVYARLRRGDHEALRTLVTRYHRPLFDFLFRLTDDRPLADDLTQQVFIRLLAHRGDSPRKIRSWLFVLARNLAYDYFRSAQFKREQVTDFTDDDGGELAEVSPEGLRMVAEQREMVAALLQRLPPEQREVVILRFYHDLSLAEIAELVNAPLGTVKSRLFHALKKLKYHLIEIGQTDA